MRRLWGIAYAFDVGASNCAPVLCNGEQQERERQEGKERAECDVGLQRAEPHHEGEDGPAEEEDSDGGVDVLLSGGVASEDVEPGDENGGVGEPESTVGRERRGAEGVPRREFPHARGKLRQPAIEGRKPDHQVRRRCHLDPPDARVEARQHERRHREPHQPQRRWVGYVPIMGRWRRRDVVCMLAHLRTFDVLRPIRRHRCRSAREPRESATSQTQMGRTQMGNKMLAKTRTLTTLAALELSK